MFEIPAAILIGWAWLLLFALGNLGAGKALGRSVWLFGRASDGKERLAALAFRLGFALLLTVPLWPLGVAPPASAAMFGVFIAALGAALGFAAQMAMGASWRVGVSDEAEDLGELVQGGLYSVSRNPAFLGQILLGLGIALAVPGGASLAGALLVMGAAGLQVRAEERLLEARHGEAYRRWKAVTPRWLGLPG